MKKHSDYIPVDFLDADMSVFFDDDIEEEQHIQDMKELDKDFNLYYGINVTAKDCRNYIESLRCNGEVSHDYN